MVFGCRALPFLPRDPCGRHPHVDCMVRNPEGVNCRGNGVSQAPSLGLISSIPITLRMGLHDRITLCYIISWHPAGFVCIWYIREFGLPRDTWLTALLNKGMSDIPTAPRIFFHLPESCVNLPGLERLAARQGVLVSDGNNVVNVDICILLRKIFCS